jgi:hypothetical protein
MVNRDDEHLRLLRIGYYIQAGVIGFFTLCALLYVFFFSLVITGVAFTNHPGPAIPRPLGLILVAFVGLWLAISLGFAALNWLTGQYLRDRRHRVFCTVIACLTCLQMPWGTVLGVLTIIVLNRPEVKAAFDAPRPGDGNLAPMQGV